MKKRHLAISLYCMVFAVSVTPQTWTVDSPSVVYNNYTKNSATITTKFRVTRSESGTSVPFYLIVTAASPGVATIGNRKIYKNGSVTSSNISINLWKSDADTEISLLTPPGGTKTIASGSMDVSETSAFVPIRVNFPSRTSNASTGTYTGVFTFQLFTGFSEYNVNAEPQVTGSLFITATAASGIRGVMSVYPTSLNFGEMHEGQIYSQTAYMSVTGIKKTKVTVSSLNSGNLKLSGTNEAIPYTIDVSATGVTQFTISSFPSTILSATTTITDRLYTLVIKTGTLGFLEAGTYTDTLTFTVTSS